MKKNSLRRAFPEWKSPASSDASLPPYELISARRRSSHCLLLLDVSLPNTLWYCRRSAVMDASEVSVACQLSLRHGSSSYPPYAPWYPPKEFCVASIERPIIIARFCASVGPWFTLYEPERPSEGVTGRETSPSSPTMPTVPSSCSALLGA